MEEFRHYSKPCSTCGEPIYYSTKRALVGGVKTNSRCRKCRDEACSLTNLKKAAEAKKALERACPTCGGIIICSSKAACDYGREHAVQCKECRTVRCKGCKKKLKKRRAVTGYCVDCYQSIYLVEHRIVDRNNPESWKRPCPQCGKEICHATWASYYAGQRYGHRCKTCGNAALRKPPVLCDVCKVTKLSRRNTSGMCGPCYLKYMESLPKVEPKDLVYSCPKCGNSITYSPESRRQFRKAVAENRICSDCHSKIPLVHLCTCIVCQTPFELDRRRYNKPRLTCSDECLRKHRLATSSYTTEEFIEISKQVHGDTWYDYSKVVYKSIIAKVIITCSRHGDFTQLPQDHMAGSGCPKCNASHGERRIRVWLEQNNIQYEYQHCFPDCVNPKTGGKLRYDFYVPDYNLLIEYDGMQHYQYMPPDKWQWTRVTSVESLESLQERDKLKDQYATDKGLELLRINFMQKYMTEKILKDAFEKLPCKSKSHTLYSTICQTSDTF